MVTLKKLIFAPFFIIFFALLTFTFNPILKSYDFIFSFSLDSLIQLAILASLFCLTSLFFVLFATISMDWKIVVPTGLLASILPMFFLNPAQGLILAVGSLVIFIVTFAILENRLKSYLTFEVSSLLGPSIRSLISLLILTMSFSYFLSVNQIIQKSGFEIPDSLIDASLKFSQPQDNQKESAAPQLSISKEQLDLLKENPQLLKQSGIDPKILDTLTEPKKPSVTSQDSTNDFLKSAVKDQLQNFIQPYKNFIPAILAILLFFTLQSLTSIVALLIYPILWLIFFILEKTGFVKFTTEMRTVRKLTL